jgi:hypothetical protein
MESEDRIEKSVLEEMFTNIRTTTSWPIDGDMLWGYFFTDADQERLERAGRELESRGYRYVGILGPDEDDDDQDTLYLHVERIETHTVETLHVRNTELYELAATLGLASYDGMDVGLVPPLN